ncbi:hypothetical protein PZA11_001779 [Diplocarpon coronariae]|nr:hypothetical protein JHW43_000891 [Diplocarpon mali]
MHSGNKQSADQQSTTSPAVAHSQQRKEADNDFGSASHRNPAFLRLFQTPPSRSRASSSPSSDSASASTMPPRPLPLSKPAVSLFSPLLLQLFRRQSHTDAIIPATYGSIDSGPSPGAVAGIVLGSVSGFLLLLWLIYTCIRFGAAPSSRSSYTESVIVRERRKARPYRKARPHRTSETVEVRRERSPVRIVVPERGPERVERIIVEETRETRRARSRGGSDDEVVVIEEHSPPRRQRSERATRSSVETERRNSGYRAVDPMAYGGSAGGRRGGRP